MSTRRAATQKRDRLAELKVARAGGGRSKQYKPEAGKLYDEVDESDYKKVVAGRLAKDDFIEDDDGGGYVDNGMDDWEGGGNFITSDDEDDKKRKKKGKAVETKPKKSARPKPEPRSEEPALANAYRPAVSADKEQEFLNSLLSSMGTDLPLIPEPPKKLKGLKRKPDPSPIENGSGRTSFRSTSAFPSDHSSDVEPFMDDNSNYSDWENASPTKKPRIDHASNRVAEGIKRISVKNEPDEYDDDFADTTFDDFDFTTVDDFGLAPQTETKKEDLNSIRSKFMPGSTSVKVDPTAKKEEKEKGPPAWLSLQSTLLAAAASSEPDDALDSSVGYKNKGSGTTVQAFEDDGSFRFFWLDYLEMEGKVYFIGKALDRAAPAGSNKKWVSCCVIVEGIERNLFVLPRPRRVENGHATDVVPTEEDVWGDFDALRRQAGIKAWGSKFVKRKYAFGEEGVAEGESEWMKVVYGFDEPQINATTLSPNFSHIFGAKTSAFELLVLKRKIMGPCWLNIKKPALSSKGVSWCALEVTVTNPKDINPFLDTDQTAPRDIPPLTMMSISIRSIMNHKENRQEIICASVRVWQNVDLDDPTPPEKQPSTVHTLVRPLTKFPQGFEARARSEKVPISPVTNEKALLSNLMALFARYDPDVLIGHEFLGVSLDIMLNRLRYYQDKFWSRLGRFKRTKLPPLSGKFGSSLKFLSGRLLCDLSSDGAKDMITSTTWSLTEMCLGQLKLQREDIDPDDTATFFDATVRTPDRLLHFVRHCEIDAYFQMAIASKVQILPLTRQLTNLAGNSWNKTLNGGRAERNEYILLHEFHRLKYICPDKTFGKKVAPVQEKKDAGDGEKGAVKKKEKYKGGLVFEPKRGLWDKYILVMDFNSLYPSIIQEYNIDFTTVTRMEDDQDGKEQIPEVPASEIPQGVLPRLIATLVNRRKQVKGLMKDRNATPVKLMQYDIKQKALKLTANSMYGCLGFEYSRFYARPLAALTTFKGREILTHTRELAESLQLDVVYGDTDSVFVNSNVTDLSEALKTSNEFKKLVNERYKLLEIDLDGIFQRLLLLQKKKYAAVKVEEGGKTSIEVKGLDMKRREYCVLSKNVSNYTLEQILSGEATETVVERIHSYLVTISDNIRGGKVGVDDFIIFKRLGKDPSAYPDAKSQPHVLVAQRMISRGNSAKAGDVIPYIFCVAEGEEPAKGGQADRAKHPDELRKAENKLSIDYDYYISQQILPPIERLCDPIEGTDRARLAECLGLDPARYKSAYNAETQEREFGTLDSLIPDKERFKESDPFAIRCRGCQGSFAFSRVGDPEMPTMTTRGVQCPSCSVIVKRATLEVQLQLQIRQHVARYYEGWTVCDDPTCGNRTRMMSVYGRRCLKPGCRGSVTFEYSDLKLYNQLLYYASLFDCDKAISSAKGTSRADNVGVIVTSQRQELEKLGRVVEKHLNKCGRRWVELGDLFSFMKVSGR